MKRKDGLYKQRGSPYWWASYVDGNGKRRRRSTRCRRRRDAARVRAKWMLDAGKGPTVERADRVTFTEMVEDLRGDYERKANRSWKRVQQALMHLRAAFGAAKATEITTARVHAYDDQRRKQGAKPATRKYELAVFARMFRVSRKLGKLDYAPQFPEITVHNAREEIITPADYASLQVELPAYLRGFVGFLYYTGWRSIREVLGLQWDQVDQKEQRVYLGREVSKNKQVRFFPYGAFPELRAIIEQQYTSTLDWQRTLGHDIPWVFHNEGQPIKSPYRAWRSACRRAGVLGRDGNPKRFHDMRRSAARRMEQRGVPRSIAMRLAGWESENMFLRYRIVTADDLNDAVALLSEQRHNLGIVDPEAGAKTPNGTTSEDVAPSDDSGGGTRTPDTRIMIPLL